MQATATQSETIDHIAEPASASEALKAHWQEYLMEAAGLGLFMISACAFAVLLGHPMSPAAAELGSGLISRLAGGIAMGLTAIGIIYSPIGKRSGAHMNPGITLTFLSLGKLNRWDAMFYVIFQFLGGAAGVALADLVIGPPLRHEAVNYAVTIPGQAGVALTFAAEWLISFVLMMTVLTVSNNARLSRYTPLFAGSLVALFIAFESPISGMSMNPA